MNIRNLKFRIGDYIRPYKAAEKITDIEVYKGPWQKGYFKALKTVGIPTSQISKSITRIKKEMRGQSKTVQHEKMALSTIEGVRIAYTEQVGDNLEGYDCIMLGTSSENPDPVHRQLEGKRMTCKKCAEHLSRFGCKHDMKVVGKTIKY